MTTTDERAAHVALPADDALIELDGHTLSLAAELALLRRHYVVGALI